MKLKELLEKYNKLIFRHMELDKELSNIELKVGDLLNNVPDVGVEAYNDNGTECTYLTAETIINALRTLYEREGWRHPKWKE